MISRPLIRRKYPELGRLLTRFSKYLPAYRVQMMIPDLNKAIVIEEEM